MSVNIPSGSGNPIGHQMEPMSSPVPAPSQEAQAAIKQALHERDAPRHLVGDEGIIQKEGLGNEPKEGDIHVAKSTDSDKP